MQDYSEIEKPVSIAFTDVFMYEQLVEYISQFFMHLILTSPLEDNDQVDSSKNFFVTVHFSFTKIIANLIVIITVSNQRDFY